MRSANPQRAHQESTNDPGPKEPLHCCFEQKGRRPLAGWWSFGFAYLLANSSCGVHPSTKYVT
jgi:hypothetical protein